MGSEKGGFHFAVLVQYKHSLYTCIYRDVILERPYLRVRLDYSFYFAETLSKVLYCTEAGVISPGLQSSFGQYHAHKSEAVFRK